MGIHPYFSRSEFNGTQTIKLNENSTEKCSTSCETSIENSKLKQNTSVIFQLQMKGKHQV